MSFMWICVMSCVWPYYTTLQAHLRFTQFLHFKTGKVQCKSGVIRCSYIRFLCKENDRERENVGAGEGGRGGEGVGGGLEGEEEVGWSEC